MSNKKIILKVPYWSQNKKKKHYTCGPVCIRMVLSYLEGKKLDKKEYLHILCLTMDGNPQKESGTSTLKLTQAIKDKGFKYRTIYGERDLTRALKRKHPVIASCRMKDEKKEPYRHYIVVTGRDDQFFYINDPYEGKRGKIQKKLFLGRGQQLNWTNNRWGVEVCGKFSKK